MKILYVISSFGIGGEQRVTSILAGEFVENGIEVDLLVFGSRLEKQFSLNNKINVIYCSIDDSSSLSKMKKFNAVRSQLKKTKYDLVLAFAVIPSIVCCAAAMGTGVPVMISERNDPRSYNKFFDVSRRLLYPFARGAVFQTRDARKCFPYLKSEICRIIPNPLNVEQLPDLCAGEKRKIIVNTARLTKVKNQMLFISAFEKIKDDYPDYTVVIYGDGPEKKNLELFINEHKLEERVFLKGAVVNVLDEIKDMSLFVLSSNNEGFPNSLAEALALGLPCVSTDCRIGGPRDLLLNRKRGILTEVGNTDSMASALDKMLKDKDFREECARNSVTVRSELDSHLIAKKWMDFISECI